MAHLVDTMAYVGQVPWHGLGEKLENGLSLDEWRVAAGMDWKVKAAGVRFPTPDGPVKFDGRNVLYRSDNNYPLSVVSDKYKVVQPQEVLEFFRDVTEAGHMQLDTAGVLDNGKKLWALARMDSDINLGNDLIKNYLLLATACDGSMATRAYYTSVRVVCNNTLQWSLSDASSGISVPHSTTFDAQAAQRALGIDVVADSVQQFAEDVTRLANCDMTADDQREYFTAVITKTALGASRDDLTKHEVKQVDILEQLAASSPGAQLETARGTAWGAVNSVTHWLDFHQRAASDNNRFKSAQFGDGARTKSRAMELALVAA